MNTREVFIMHIHYLAIRVNDLEKSLHFYQTLTDLKIAKRFSANPGELAYLQDKEGATQIELICLSGDRNVKASGMFLCFGTDDLDKAHDIAVKEGMNPSDIRQPEPDARYFYVYDPDGLSVQLREYK